MKFKVSWQRAVQRRGCSAGGGRCSDAARCGAVRAAHTGTHTHEGGGGVRAAAAAEVEAGGAAW